MFRVCKTIIFFLSLPFLFISCSGSDEVIIPDNVLGKEEFEKVLFDMSLAEAAINVNVKNVPFEKMDSVYAFDVLKENNVTRAQYDTSIHFYSLHPDLYKEVFEKVLERLSRFETNALSTDTAKIKQ